MMSFAAPPANTPSGYQWHSYRGPGNLPQLDMSLSALLDDLDERGLLDTTLVVVMGEFGRTPRINKDGGRDHYPNAGNVLMAGAGVNRGVIGATDRSGGYPTTPLDAGRCGCFDLPCTDLTAPISAVALTDANLQVT
jgi:uncharacterized protein (DUF1501 family)